jgi:dUTP pyrophosphatase
MFILMELMVKIINHSKHELPNYQTAGAAGLDLKANLLAPTEILPGERCLIPTGLFVELPLGFEAQIRPRSGLALKYGVTVLNSPGTVDADYRGELKVLLVNFSKEIFLVNDGDRIAQMVIAKHERVVWQEVAALHDTERGAGGYGSTGI